jgi:heme-degrading monooxygenase HmoA
MILEIEILNAKAGQGAEFEAAFEQAAPIIASMPGYMSHELQRCLENPARYALLVRWQTLEITRLAFVARPSIRNGGDCFTISTIRFQPWSILN